MIEIKHQSSSPTSNTWVHETITDTITNPSEMDLIIQWLGLFSKRITQSSHFCCSLCGDFLLE